MTTPHANSTHAAKAWQIESSLQAINTRIARLSLMLGVKLERESDLQSVLVKQHPAYVAASQSHMVDAASFKAKRLHQEWEELRGLLSMRCELMAHSLQDLGLKMTRDIADQAEINLVRNGFEPSASGFHLHRQMNDV